MFIEDGYHVHFSDDDKNTIGTIKYRVGNSFLHKWRSFYGKNFGVKLTIIF